MQPADAGYQCADAGGDHQSARSRPGRRESSGTREGRGVSVSIWCSPDDSEGRRRAAELTGALLEDDIDVHVSGRGCGSELQESLRAGLRGLSAADADYLSTLVAALAQAKSAGDAGGAEHFIRLATECLLPTEPGEPIDLGVFEAVAARTETGRQAIREIEAEEQTFFDRYQRLKAATGLNTYRKVAAAAGVALSTVQAIESARIKPQFRTIEKFARAFGVSIGELLGR